ncbi:MAG: iron ABC transporter permease [Methanocorpusculum sp.]|uniref:FecCD family ABC transporter permease n=1 Tax=Methanocorpusculum sp. TaxID=2058474 RepID=UPI002718EB22|nr:iron ABC transporter permease [Methanocorpusculum sp.]MDO9522376.1 iron ABC transporter permease [Methanocorpusculum sp.]
MKTVSKKSFFIFLFFLPIAVACLALCVGRYWINPIDVYGAFLAFFGYPVETTIQSVVLNLRLPRILLALFVGAGLAIAGTAFQSTFSNPLASPDIIGVSSGAAFGAALGLLLFENMFIVQILAIIFGLAAIGITFALSKAAKTDSILMIVLAGIIVSGFFTAMISLVKYTADPLLKLPEITFWLMGSLAGANYEKIVIAAPLLLLGIIIIWIMKWRLNILALSEEEIQSCGINPKRTRWTIIIAATLIVAATVSLCGQIGWVGLVIPHVARMLVGSDNRYVIPASISIGACYLLIIDTLCRTISPSEIPLSIMTALIGAPLFAYLFLKKARSWL